MTEERFEEFLRRTLDDLEPVPPTPRDAMWSRIDEARRFSRRAQRGTRRHVWLQWGVGLAAMLAIGIGLGRMTAREQNGATPVVAQVTDATPNRVTYQVAVAQHLGRAEALLTSFRTETRGAAVDPQLAAFARDLLTTTQMLLDSPAADDAKVAALLEDLELILAQIARMSAPSAEEREIIQDGMNKTAVLPRLRANSGAPVAAGT